MAHGSQKLTADDIYAGSRLAILEMIKSGTVFLTICTGMSKSTAQSCRRNGNPCGYRGLNDGPPVGGSQISQFAKLDSYKATDRVFYTVAPAYHLYGGHRFVAEMYAIGAEE